MFTSEWWLRGAIGFASAAVLDVVWAFYMGYVAKELPHRAAAWGMGTVIIGAITTVNVVHDVTLLLFSGPGAYLGTYLAVAKARRATEKASRPATAQGVTSGAAEPATA